MVLAAIYFMSVFSGASGDSDMWWHLAAGKYIWQNHRLPVPDPFAYTTDMGTPVYAGELTTRHFNLTHEWGMELIYYLVQVAAGFPGLILLRALLLSSFCGMTGWLAWRRSGSFYRGLFASLIASSIAIQFVADRAFLATFVMVTLTVAAFETRRGLWLLPPAFLVWSNCHGGYVMGWAIAGAYSAEALFFWLRGKPLADERKVWAVSVLAVLVSLWNPNGLHVIEVMRHYRDSPLQIAIFEWSYPAWWPPDSFNLMMVGTLGVMLWARRRVHVRDWLLFAALGGSASMAIRNVIFIGFIGPVLLATYLPEWRRRVTVVLEYAAAAFLVTWISLGISRGSPFQLRASIARYPAEAADFLVAHRVTVRMFNTYEHGGYLMWRLWPGERVFIDGRALNESVYEDYRHIAYNADSSEGRTAQDLLRQYGVQVIVMDGFDFNGQVYFLAAALADPSQKEWKLVYQDVKSVVYMREPPPGVQPLPSLDALSALEAQCNYNVDHGLGPACERSLGDVFMRVGDWKRSRKWLGDYLSVNGQDPLARRMWQRVTGGNRN